MRFPHLLDLLCVIVVCCWSGRCLGNFVDSLLGVSQCIQSILCIFEDFTSHRYSFILEPLWILELFILSPVNIFMILWSTRNPCLVFSCGRSKEFTLVSGLSMSLHWWRTPFLATWPFVFFFEWLRFVVRNVGNLESAKCLMNNGLSVRKLYMRVSSYSRSWYFFPGRCRFRWKTRFLKVGLCCLMHFHLDI